MSQLRKSLYEFSRGTQFHWERLDNAKRMGITASLLIGPPALGYIFGLADASSLQNYQVSQIDFHPVNYQHESICANYYHAACASSIPEPTPLDQLKNLQNSEGEWELAKSSLGKILNGVVSGLYVTIGAATGLFLTLSYTPKEKFS